MERNIPEADWRLFRQLHPVALERFSQRVLSEVARLASDTARTSHERYLDVFHLLKVRDEEMAVVFDDLRRSMAYFRLAAIQSHGLLTEDEFARFSQETRDRIQSLLAMGR